MQRYFVLSSWVDWVEYDPATRIMRVSLRSGRYYDFPDTAQEIVDELIMSPSVGRAFGRMCNRRRP